MIRVVQIQMLESRGCMRQNVKKGLSWKRFSANPVKSQAFEHAWLPRYVECLQAHYAESGRHKGGRPHDVDRALARAEICDFERFQIRKAREIEPIRRNIEFVLAQIYETDVAKAFGKRQGRLERWSEPL